MTHPNINVALYKFLTYAKECFCKGINPNMDIVRDALDMDPAYFNNIVRMASDEGLVTGVEWSEWQDYKDQVITPSQWAITLKGVEYLENNSLMAKARHAVGTTFASALAAAIEATVSKSLGL